jgi:heme-degrading monooxygenase HmoA
MFDFQYDLPYYAVIFTSKLDKSTSGYEEMAIRMEALAKQQEGFLGIESARSTIGITVSYWKSLESIKAWKLNLEHEKARKLGRERWYKEFHIRIAKVEKEYGFKK